MATVCIKVKNLRKITGDENANLEKWMRKSNNVYTGRRGRIFIHEGGSKRIFHYKDSKWANPYPVGTAHGKYSLVESLRLYVKHLFSSGLILKIDELRGKNLGCFCDQSGKEVNCHAKVLSGLLGKCYYLIKPFIKTA